MGKKSFIPYLNEFYLHSFLYDRPHFQKNDPSYLKLIESTEPKNEQNLAAPKLFSMASVGDMKRKLLKENGKLMDRFISTSSLFSNKGAQISEGLEDKRSESKLDQVSIQEWIKSQQKDKISSDITYPLEQQQISMQNIVNDAADPSGMIYMASIAAAAATSAGLASVQHKVSFKEHNQMDDISRMKSLHKSKLKAVRSRRKDISREDPSACIPDFSAPKKSFASLISDDDQLSSSATRVNGQSKNFKNNNKPKKLERNQK